MHYLGLALYAEGAGDYQFLRPLLQRLCTDICLQHAQRMVDVSEVISLNHSPSHNELSRPLRVVDAARQHLGAWNILFVHGDGSGDAGLARQQLVQPALDALGVEFPGVGSVAVVPVRESEAWAVCDGDALRQVFRTTLDDVGFGIPNAPHAVEALLDPKAALSAAFNATNPPSQRKRQGVGQYLGALGDSIGLGKLRCVPSFSSMEQELTQTLDAIGVFR